MGLQSGSHVCFKNVLLILSLKYTCENTLEFGFLTSQDKLICFIL